MARRFASVDRREVMTSIEELCDRIRVLNAQVLNPIGTMVTKSPNVALGQLNVHVASLNVQLVQLKHKISILEQAAVDVYIRSRLQRGSPSATLDELSSRSEERSFEENDVSNFNVTLPDSPVECAIIMSAENVHLNEMSEKSRRAKRRSRSLSIVVSFLFSFPNKNLKTCFASKKRTLHVLFSVPVLLSSTLRSAYLDALSSERCNTYLFLVPILQKKMIRRLTRSVTPSRRLLTSDNVDADVTLCEHN
ncbi:unnamed protein product [Angiostrongylus costaricensis]|uniref:Lzipper-MIP1 domain-containing protein n=1 Tax=Angiostrongylus costaricensis TaxID=334426 RepID=A0A0R3PG77_ANGCS|nr:unnamed protein product [Angiostrongylus costaricensis]